MDITILLLLILRNQFISTLNKNAVPDVAPKQNVLNKHTLPHYYTLAGFTELLRGLLIEGEVYHRKRAVQDQTSTVWSDKTALDEGNLIGDDIGHFCKVAVEHMSSVVNLYHVSNFDFVRHSLHLYELFKFKSAKTKGNQTAIQITEGLFRRLAELLPVKLLSRPQNFVAWILLRE